MCKIQIFIFVALFILLAVSVKLSSQEDEKNTWIKIILYYASSLVVLNIDIIDVPIIAIPIGLIIALYFLIKKASENIQLKKLALIFGLFYFVTSIMLPPIKVNELLNEKEKHVLLNQFIEIESIYEYSPESMIQDEIKEYVQDRIEMQFITWVLKNRGIEIKDKEDLLFSAAHENHDFYYVGKYINAKTRHVYVSFNDGSGEYFGLFKMDEQNHEYYLKTVIKHGGRKGGYPSLI